MRKSCLLIGSSDFQNACPVTGGSLMRIAFALICSLTLASLAGPAGAADYHVVRHQRTVRYVPVGEYRTHYVTPYHVRYTRPCLYGLPTGRYRHVQFSEINYSGVVAYAGHDCYWRKAPRGDGWASGLTKICY
jgi:hypothetical protein